jgi:eukaryotic-like serine/threonine-protein kinase
MAKPAKNPSSSDVCILPVDKWRLDATVPYCEEGYHDANGLPKDRIKPLRDLAFAVSLCDSGLMSEGQLALATRDWTAFGATKLADHLLAEGDASEVQLTEVQRCADVLFRKTISHSSRANTSANVETYQQLVVALNSDGRLANLLGLHNNSNWSLGEIGDRNIGARYTLLRKLGQGGLGTVWLAHDENLKRYVALKEMNADAQTGDISLAQFRREAEITGRLEHPGIVPIHQFGRDEKSGKAFYVMRFLGRRTLQDAINEYHERLEGGTEEKMLLHRLLSAFVSICHAVGHAHARKVIHRDLKPANVALDEFGQVTLLDWGLSKVNDETGMYHVAGRPEPGDLHDLNALQAGRVIGTPLYMAPEQAAGRLEDVDELTDVYGLGGILYSILTGVGPHQATSTSVDTGIGREQFLSRIVADEVVPPKKRTARVQPELNAICLKALSQRRYRRYQSAAELAEDIQRYMAGTTVHAYEAPMQRQLARWMVRHPTLAQMLLLALTLILIAGIAVALTAREGRQRLERARFASAVESARDLEVNLQFEASALERDLHFITELPLMSATNELQPTLPAPFTPSSQIQKDASRPQALAQLHYSAPWLDRQGELFDGFLNANPSYLMMATCICDDEQNLREVVRSERAMAGLRTKRIPLKQLKTSTAASDTSDSEILSLLRPGYVLMATNDQFRGNIPVVNHSPLVLSSISAIYDSQGEFNGINMIELDLQDRLRKLIPAIAPEYVNVYVTDALGQIMMDYRNGRFVELAGAQSIVNEFPGLRQLFRAASNIRELGDGQLFYAKLVQLGQSPARARVGIVTHNRDE